MKNDFEQLIREAVCSLPEQGRKAMDNVAFVVEEEARPVRSNHAGRDIDAPARHTSNGARPKSAKEVGIRVDEVVLGLYEGVPKTKRGENYFGVLPDKITIFQRPIEALAGRDEKKLKKLIHGVVWHEVGHHLGFDEKEIRELEAKKRKNMTNKKII